MARQLAQSTRSRRLLIAATATATAILLLALGLEYGSTVSNVGKADRPPAPTEGSGSAANPLALSVFEQPRPVREIRFQDDQGHDLTLANFRGRVVLLNIWATWCVPCRNEMPTLDRLQTRLGGRDFQVIALSIDRKGVEAVKDFSRGRGRKAGDLSRSLREKIARPRDSGCADDVAHKSRGRRGCPQIGRSPMGQP